MEEENPQENESKIEGEKIDARIDNNPDKINISKLKERFKGNPWLIVSIILGVIVVILLVLLLRGGVTGNVVSGEDAGHSIINYLNSRTGGGVDYVSYEDKGNLYEVLVRYQGQEIPVYVTKDGEYFVQGVLPITKSVPVQQEQQSPQQADIPKSDKPKVELFVMTYCPYGTQAEKGLIPVLELLGDKIEGGIKFVHYFMHGDKEEKETYRQVCIREEQKDKYLDYLKCFLEDGDSERCLTKTKIDRTKLGSCISNNAKNYYASDSELSQKYGVRGSPTLVINGQMVSSGRASASFLNSICSAFNDVPEECNEELSSESPSPGFGYSASSGSNSQAQCG